VAEVRLAEAKRLVADRRFAAAAGLPHGDIEVIGDSHAVTRFAPIVRCRVHWLGPQTMHHVARPPIDLGALGIGAGANLVIVLGEVDCRWRGPTTIPTSRRSAAWRSAGGPRSCSTTGWP
jgi:hypothetical protein